MSRYNPKGKMTKAQREHIEAVSKLPCIVTDSNNVQIHHITECGRRLGHEWVLPLDVETHRNIHLLSFQAQMILCHAVYEKLGKVMPEPISKLDYKKTIC